MPIFPSLEGFGPTRDTLHLYAQAVDVFPRAHAAAHPKWWHIGLCWQPGGFTTAEMPLPGGGVFRLVMDFRAHRIELYARGMVAAAWDMSARYTGTALGDSLIAAVAGLGVRGEYLRQRFESRAARAYDKAHAAAWFAAAGLARAVFEQHRANVGEESGPVHLWPHHFDLTAEVFGSRRVEYEEHGQVQSFPSQLNLGFSTGDANHPSPYFYSNPFPFETKKLLGKPLPHGARWQTAPWQGSILPYSEVAGRNDGPTRLLAYVQAVYKAARPILER
ncbi:MAG: hypothetical protein HYZ26_02615 [Chloroflexi bacterium]|nr:hypothetical protein [Chloroflexota bacterium]